MMATFSSNLTDCQRARAARLIRKQAVAERLRAKPWAGVETVATSHRTAARNTVAFRSQRKRLGGSALCLTAGEARRIADDSRVVALRQELAGGDPGALAALLNAIAELMAAAIAAKVASNLQRQTGQLEGSVRARVGGV
jgi:hypothetical protein